MRRKIKLVKHIVLYGQGIANFNRQNSLKDSLTKSKKKVLRSKSASFQRKNQFTLC